MTETLLFPKLRQVLDFINVTCFRCARNDGSATSRLKKWISFSLALVLSAFYCLPRTTINILNLTGPINLATDGGYSSVHGVFAFGIALVSLSLFLKLVRVKHQSARFIWLIMLTYIVMCGFSCFGGVVPLVAACTLILISLAVGLLAARLCGSVEQVFLLLTVIGAIEAAYAVAGYLNGSLVMFSGSVVRAAGTFSQPNSLYVEMLFGIYSAMYWLLKSRKHTLSLSLAALACGCMICALILTWNRGAFIALSIGILYLCFPFLRKKRLTMATGVLLLVGFCALSFMHRSPTIADGLQANRSAASRATIALRDLHIIKTHFFTGVGIYQNQKLVTANTNNLDTPLSKNLLLNAIVEMGCFGFLMFSGLCASIRSSIISGRGFMLRQILGATWISLFVAGLFDVPFLSCLRLEGNNLFAILIGATMMVRQKHVGQQVQ